MRHFALLLASLLCLAGCTPQSGSSFAPNHAQCLVCKHENDLACVDIDVDSHTPRLTYEGKDFCFCSEQCKKEFAARPTKYQAGR